jgi:hypothetical protein
MGKFFIFFLLTICTFTVSVEARLQPNCGGWGFSGEWLYFQPAVDSPYFVLEATDDLSPPVGPRRANRFNHRSGWRVEGAYAFCNCCNDFRLRWTSWQGRHRRDVAGTFLWPILASPAERAGEFLAFPGRASSNARIRFQSGEALLGHYFFTRGPFDFSLEGGVQYAYISYRHNVLYSPDPLPETGAPVFRSRSTFSGAGPEIGIDFGYDVCGGFGISGRAMGSLLVGKNTSQTFFEDFTTRPLIDTTNDPLWRVVPAADLRLGLMYGCTFSCFSWNIEAGYEVLHYGKSLSMTQFTSGSFNTSVSIDQYSDLSLHGPYVALGVTF